MIGYFGTDTMAENVTLANSHEIIILWIGFTYSEIIYRLYALIIIITIIIIISIIIITINIIII